MKKLTKEDVMNSIKRVHEKYYANISNIRYDLKEQGFEEPCLSNLADTIEELIKEEKVEPMTSPYPVLTPKK